MNIPTPTKNVMFAAAQAAQKELSYQVPAYVMFAAAQAAQKVPSSE